MTNDEAKEAFRLRKPVYYNGIRYLKITAIIYRYDDRDNLIISAELLDRNRNCVVTARLQDVKAEL